ncbi:hypothetical protein BHE74_00027691 [Ensete ventricosum]|nr:hypothetical protein GW17_00032279 [Ensete ventricosum]RWW65029.1 hypothetical protein BHE74_00027691 [Ensete ventricosum]RZR94256.1 hypothetical protein BHM03_00022926 [Ensete ventricosum]
MQGPVNYICLHCVKPSLRPLSMAMSTVSIHIFGDVPSSPLVGVLQVCFLYQAVPNVPVLYRTGIFLKSVDRFNEDSEQGVPSVERSNRRPLLDVNVETLEESA